MFNPNLDVYTEKEAAIDFMIQIGDYFNLHLQMDFTLLLCLLYFYIKKKKKIKKMPKYNSAKMELILVTM